MRSVLFEDPFVSELDPIALARPAYSISCGGISLYDALRRATKISAAVVRPHLRAIEEADRQLSVPDRSDEATLLVNARLVPSTENLRVIEELLGAEQPCCLFLGERIAALHVPPGETIPDTTRLESYRSLEGLAHSLTRVDKAGLSMLSLPHDVVAQHLLHFGDGLNRRIESGDYCQLSDGLFVDAERSTLDPLIRCDTSKGPILIEQGARIGPFTYLRGPVYIGKNAIINEHTSVKDNVFVGHHSKVGGEVEETVIEPYSNKQHHGFLGHSYIGSWVNLGAGTSNSDLKNTYGEIRIDYDSGRTNTGLQFLGCMIGDYTKSAINTSIFTGKIIGACSMLYGFITTNVPSFANYARTFGQITELPDHVLIETQRRMFQRRKIVQRPIDAQLLRDMYQLVKQKRQLVEERLAL